MEAEDVSSFDKDQMEVFLEDGPGGHSNDKVVKNSGRKGQPKNHESPTHCHL